jgi:hypothetical protein
MKLTASKLNKFSLNCQRLSVVCVSQLLMKTMCGICKHRWINQNPFNSMYFAVQAMAAELATGALVMFQIQKW